MANGWTLERRLRQAEHIRRWRPWANSTGPRTDKGKAAASKNAYTGGHRQRLRADIKLLQTVLREHGFSLKELKV